MAATATRPELAHVGLSVPTYSSTDELPQRPLGPISYPFFAKSNQLGAHSSHPTWMMRQRISSAGTRAGGVASLIGRIARYRLTGSPRVTAGAVAVEGAAPPRSRVPDRVRASLALLSPDPALRASANIPPGAQKFNHPQQSSYNLSQREIGHSSRIEKAPNVRALDSRPRDRPADPR
jgi:hypothetical protein